MKYKAGDRVKIKSLDWYNKNKSKSHGTVACGGKYFDYDMREWCGKIMTILTAYQTCYIMQEDGAKDLWTDEMIEGLVEEETKPNIIEEAKTYWDSIKDAWICPEGYQFVDENGNIINATKIVLEKKKKEYPKTYKECCEILGLNDLINMHLSFMDEDAKIIASTNYHIKTLIGLNCLTKLRICRDAYWKIAGEDMGLGKPWEPDWNHLSDKWVLFYTSNRVGFQVAQTRHSVFAFPTEEMRDAFKENFDPDIEICKELL